jgi:hypothetical protein
MLPEQDSQVLFEALVDGLCLQRAYNESFFSNTEIDQEMRQTVDLFYDREHPASPTETRGETGCEIDSASTG